MPFPHPPPPDLLPARWRWRPLLLCNALALLLLGSWLWAPTRQLWDAFDNALFVDLNASLAWSRAWAALWAVMNLRPMDLVGGLIMGAVVLRGNLVVPASRVRAVLFTLVSILLLVLLTRATIEQGVVKPLHLERASPSLVETNVIRLSELFPDWTLPVKDASRTSFPGDHAAVILTWALLLSHLARGWRRLVVWLVAGVLLLPRLVAGAHWGSDDFVGGLFVALLSLGWGCYTPYAARAEAALETFTQPWRLRLTRDQPVMARRSVMR